MRHEVGVRKVAHQSQCGRGASWPYLVYAGS